ncbi:MAG: class I SAM-dependent methyltransferase [Deltaproteobacteria bacterium]|nr:class I SAM-dependent methyltransferase [Deltaproteobacteria bacterium]
MLFPVNGCEILRCGTCDFTQVAEAPRNEDIKRIYGDAYFHSGKYGDRSSQRWENEMRLSLVRRFLKDGGARILEAGCGTGDFISLAKGEYEMSGFDLSETAVEIARRNNRDMSDHLWTAGIEEQELSPSSYDAVCLWDVIEHLSDPVSVCRKLMYCLKPGGYLFLSTPITDAWAARLLGKYWPFMTPPEHLGFFSRKSLRHLFEDLLGSSIAYNSARGKWVNIGFAFYKVRRVLPSRVPDRLLSLFQTGVLSKFSVYIPAQGICYIAVRKSGG